MASLRWKLGLAAEPDAVLHRALAPFACALADKLTFKFRDGREHGDEQAALRGRGIEKRITERRSRLSDAMDQVERLALATGNFTSSAKSLAISCCGSAALVNG
jgi:hypothetical protein